MPIDHFSAIVFTLAKPSSNFEPIILSMLKNMVINLLMKGLGPNMACVTIVVSPRGMIVKSIVLWPSMGFMKSILSTTLD